MENLKAQREEILVLQSIFSEDSLTIDEEVRPTGRFMVNVNVPTSFQVHCSQFENNCNDESFTVQYLPPINLFFEFPETYPSETCPAFLLTCNWLNLEQLSNLCQELGLIWERADGEVVLFQWISFLQEETLSFLHIAETLDVTKISRYKYGLKRFKNTLGKKHFSCSNPAVEGNSLSLNIKNVSDENSVELRNIQSAMQDIEYINTGLMLKPTVDRGTKLYDQRAVVEVTNNLLLLLQEFNKYKKQQIFQGLWFECEICLLSKQGKYFMIFNECNHIFCCQCLTSYFEVQIRDGNVGSLNCPDGNCRSQADGTQVKELVCSELYNKYDTLLLARTLDGMSDVVYCPRPDCQCAVLMESDSIMGCCAACKYVFCILCRKVYHGVAPCELKSTENKKICKKYMDSKGEERVELEKRYGKRVLKLLTENMLSEEWKDENSKKCPRCETNIEKTEGCNKMTCFRCGLYFCWLCGIKLKSTNPYEHFSDRNSPCFRQLFPDDYLYDDEEVQPGEFLNLRR